MSTPHVPPPLAAGRLSQAEYARNFADAHPPLTPVQALLEAERCYYCHDAPCTTAIDAFITGKPKPWCQPRLVRVECAYRVHLGCLKGA